MLKHWKDSVLPFTDLVHYLLGMQTKMEFITMQ